VAEYVLGFRDLAERLGPAVVGEPLEDEAHVTPWLAVQFTSRGIMLYSARANRAGFLAFSEAQVAPSAIEPAWVADRLPVEPRNELETRALSEIKLVAVHWSAGVYADGYDPVAAYTREAREHIARDWGGGARGYGLMYHERISRDGRVWATRPAEHVVWAATRANRIAYNVCMDAGPACEPAGGQVAALEERVGALLERFRLPRAAVYGHGELGRYGNYTACPGQRLTAWCRAYRRSNE
jgi:hypothetical protein